MSHSQWKIIQIISYILLLTVLIVGQSNSSSIFLLLILMIMSFMQRLWYLDTKVFAPLYIFITTVVIYYAVINLTHAYLKLNIDFMHLTNLLIILVAAYLLWQLGLKYIEAKYIHYSVIMYPREKDYLYTSDIQEELSDQEIMGIFEFDNSSRQVDDRSIQKLKNFISHNPVDQVILIDIHQNLNQKLIQELLNLGIVIDLIDQDIRLIPEPLNKKHQILLSILMDKVFALVGLIGCILVGIVIGIGIKLEDGGPILYSQKRVGRNGRIFNFYKFRSMKVNSDEITQELLKENEMSGLMFKLENDPRITKIGKFIRKTSLDELPQFYNILIGNMTMVGTRPPTLSEYESYTLNHKQRLGFKVGLTGNWQVSGRNEITDFDEVIKLDTDFMHGWSFWRDIQIILKTFTVVLRREGAK